MSESPDAPAPVPPPKEVEPDTAPVDPPSDGHVGTGGAPMHAGDSPDVD